MDTRPKSHAALALLAAACLLVTGIGATPALAQADDTTDALTKQERKQQAKEERIQEYLRKREERQIEKEATRQQRAEKKATEEQAREIEREQLAAEKAVEEAERLAAEQAEIEERGTATEPELPSSEEVARAEKKAAKKRARQTQDSSSHLPRELARAQANVRATEIGEDPTVKEYLDLIDRQGASPHQLAAFGSFIAQNGMTRDATEYYRVALHLEDDDPVLWINAGTLYLQAGEPGDAAEAFGRALTIAPNNAFAHYNMGAALHEMDRYENAIEAYKTALALDPDLGDPSVNPQAANNKLLLAVRLMLYQEQMGSLGTPLLDLSTGKLPGQDEEVSEE
jgi:tetratricopeptide (TPR) repeat protein